MKSEYSLGDRRKRKEILKVLKKELSNRIRFFYSAQPYENRTSLSIAFRSSIRNSKLFHFVA